MNIFYVDRDPGEAARALVDRHIRKMGVEAAQMLSGAYLRPEASEPPPLTASGKPYRGGFPHHPASRWSRETREQWQWLAEHARAIFEEYAFRFGKRQASADAVADMLSRPPVWLPRGWREPAQCMPDRFKGEDAVAAYRRFYRVEKAPLFHWTRRTPPDWLADAVASGGDAGM